MDSLLQTAITNITAADGKLSALEAQVKQLQSQPPLLTYIFADVQLDEQPGNVGNTGGGSAQAHGTYTIGRNPQVLTAHPASAFDNFYFLKRLASLIPASKLTSASSMVHSGNYSISSLSACQALEGDMQLQVGTLITNIGWQILPTPGVAPLFRIWNRASHMWVATAVPIAPSILTGTFSVEIGAHFDNQSIQYDYAKINGVRTPLTMQTTPLSTTAIPNPEYNIATQLDTVSKALQYSVTVSNLTAQIT